MHGGVGGCLKVNDFRIVLDRGLHSSRVSGIYKGGSDTQRGQDLTHNNIGAAINGISADDMIAHSQQAKQRRTDGAHTGGGSYCILSTLQLSNFFLKNTDSRISGARIVIAGNFAAENTHGIIRSGECKGRGLIDRSGQGTIVTVAAITSVNSLCIEASLVHINVAHSVASKFFFVRLVTHLVKRYIATIVPIIKFA